MWRAESEIVPEKFIQKNKNKNKNPWTKTEGSLKFKKQVWNWD
jgi:hypothetical protein